MNKGEILNKFMSITQQSFLVFVNQVEEKPDNTFETLKLLSDEEKVTAGRIAEHLDIKPSSVTQIIKKLENAGTAKRVKSEDDARVTFVELSDKGRETLNAQGNISSGLKDEMFKGFTDEELETLDSFLNRIDDNLSSETFKEKIESVFGDDKRWEHLGQMSARFGRAREQMLERGGFEGLGGIGNRGGFDGQFGGFEGWKKGRNK